MKTKQVLQKCRYEIVTNNRSSEKRIDSTNNNEREFTVTYILFERISTSDRERCRCFHVRLE